MSSANVLPSAPREGEKQSIYRNHHAGLCSTETQTISPQDFGLAKVNETAATLAQEVSHYWLVGKKYKQVKTVTNWLVGGSGVFSAAVSNASLGTALSVIGIPAAVPLRAVGGCFALASSWFVIAGKKHDAKIKKHHEIVTLALAKRDTVDRLLSKAINDNRLSDAGFQIIISELEQYNVLKEKVRAKLTRKPSCNNAADVDVEKVKKDVGRSEVEAEF